MSFEINKTGEHTQKYTDDDLVRMIDKLHQYVNQANFNLGIGRGRPLTANDFKEAYSKRLLLEGESKPFPSERTIAQRLGGGRLAVACAKAGVPFQVSQQRQSAYA